MTETTDATPIEHSARKSVLSAALGFGLGLLVCWFAISAVVLWTTDAPSVDDDMAWRERNLWHVTFVAGLGTMVAAAIWLATRRFVVRSIYRLSLATAASGGALFVMAFMVVLVASQPGLNITIGLLAGFHPNPAHSELFPRAAWSQTLLLVGSVTVILVALLRLSESVGMPWHERERLTALFTGVVAGAVLTMVVIGATDRAAENRAHPDRRTAAAETLGANPSTAEIPHDSLRRIVRPQGDIGR